MPLLPVNVYLIYAGLYFAFVVLFVVFEDEGMSHNQVPILATLYQEWTHSLSC